jgi:hypothetical protein
MTQPRKSMAELLAERAAAKAQAKPAEPPAIEAEPEPAQEAKPEPIAITVEPAPALLPILVPARRLPPLPYNPIPSNKTCGARTRAGTPCQSRALYRSGRCKNHGGLSTGPKSAEGKAKVARNGSAPKRRKAKPLGG